MRAARTAALGVLATTLMITLIPGASAAPETASSAPPVSQTSHASSAAPRAVAAALAISSPQLTRAERRELRAQRERAAERRADARRATRAQQREDRARAMRERAAEVAIAQIGDAYIGGADGPHAFDCSGLTQYAWRKAGVELTHYSGAQWKETRRISIAKAEPGDLAFYFENGAHHVAMYVGNGMVVGAVDYGIGVKKTPLVGTPWTDLHFSGMGRVI
jgi:cell wall-associated NlpC family hydrolase